MVGVEGTPPARWRAPCRTGRGPQGSSENQKAVHPASNIEPRTRHIARLQPGRPTAPEGGRLPLLPSGPDGVHGPSLRGTRPSTSSDGVGGGDRRPRPGIQPRCSGLRVQGTASSPPSTAAADGSRAVGIGQSGLGVAGGCPSDIAPGNATDDGGPDSGSILGSRWPAHTTGDMARPLSAASCAVALRGVMGRCGPVRVFRGTEPPTKDPFASNAGGWMPPRSVARDPTPGTGAYPPGFAPLPGSWIRGGTGAAWRGVGRMAERGGFEPPTGCPEPHFQCGAIGL
jgi:hypothetical protein